MPARHCAADFRRLGIAASTITETDTTGAPAATVESIEQFSARILRFNLDTALLDTVSDNALALFSVDPVDSERTVEPVLIGGQIGSTVIEVRFSDDLLEGDACAFAGGLVGGLRIASASLNAAAPITVLSIESNPGEDAAILITLSDEVTVLDYNLLEGDFALTLDGSSITPQETTQPSPTTIRMLFDVESTAGYGYAWTQDNDQTSPPITLPVSGTVS
jgi:hypothetical protein